VGVVLGIFRYVQFLVAGLSDKYGQKIFSIPSRTACCHPGGGLQGIYYGRNNIIRNMTKIL
jgi:hypothetical protein